MQPAATAVPPPLPPSLQDQWRTGCLLTRQFGLAVVQAFPTITDLRPVFYQDDDFEMYLSDLSQQIAKRGSSDISSAIPSAIPTPRDESVNNRAIRNVVAGRRSQLRSNSTGGAPTGQLFSSSSSSNVFASAMFDSEAIGNALRKKKKDPAENLRSLNVFEFIVRTLDLFRVRKVAQISADDILAEKMHLDDIDASLQEVEESKKKLNSHFRKKHRKKNLPRNSFDLNVSSSSSSDSEKENGGPRLSNASTLSEESIANITLLAKDVELMMLKQKSGRMKEAVKMWVDSIRDAWYTLEPVDAIHGTLSFFPETNTMAVVKYCLYDLFIAADVKHCGSLEWNVLVVFLADCSSLSRNQNRLHSTKTVEVIDDDVPGDIIIYEQGIRSNTLHRLSKYCESFERGLFFAVFNERGTELDQIQALDATNFRVLRTHDVGDDRILSMDYIGTMNLLVVIFYSELRLIDADNWVCKARLSEPGDGVSASNWIPELTFLACGTRAGKIQLYDLSDVDRSFFSNGANPLEDIPHVERHLHSETVSRVHDRLAHGSVVSASLDGSIALWALESGVVRRICGGIALGFDISDHLQLVFGFGVDPWPFIWSFSEAAAKPVQFGGDEGVTPPHTARIVGVTVLNYPKNAAVSVDRHGNVRLWDLWERTCLQQISIMDEDNPIGSLDNPVIRLTKYLVSPDKFHFHFPLNRCMLRLKVQKKKETATGQLASLHPISCIAHCPETRLFLVGSGNMLTMWNSLTCAPIHSLMHVSPSVTDEVVDMCVYEQAREVVLSTRQGYIVTVSLGNAIIRHLFQHPAKRMITAFIKITNASKLIVSANHEALSVDGDDVKPFHMSGVKQIGFSSICIHSNTNFLLAAHDNSPIVSVWDVSTQCNNLWLCLACYSVPTSSSSSIPRRSISISPSNENKKSSHHPHKSKLDISVTATLAEQIAEEEADDAFRLVADMRKTGHCVAYDTSGVIHLLELLDLTQCNADPTASTGTTSAVLHRRMSTLARLAQSKDPLEAESSSPLTSSRFREYKLVCRNRWLHCPVHLPVEGARVSSLAYLSAYKLILAADTGGSLTVYDISDATSKCSPTVKKEAEHLTTGQFRNSRRLLKVESSKSFKAAEVWGTAQPFLSSVEDAMGRQAQADNTSAPFLPLDIDEEASGDMTQDESTSNIMEGGVGDATDEQQFGVFSFATNQEKKGGPRRGSGEGVVKLGRRSSDTTKQVLASDPAHSADGPMASAKPDATKPPSPTRRRANRPAIKFVAEAEPASEVAVGEAALGESTTAFPSATFGDYVTISDDRIPSSSPSQHETKESDPNQPRQSQQLAKPSRDKHRPRTDDDDRRNATNFMCGVVYRVHSVKLASDEAPAAITRMLILDPPLVSIVTASSEGRVVMWSLFGKKCGQFALGPTFREPLFAKMNHISLGQRIYAGHTERLSAFDDVVPPYTNPERVMPQDGRDAAFQSRRPGMMQHALELPFPCDRLDSLDSLNDCEGKTPQQVLTEIATLRPTAKDAISAQMKTRKEREQQQQESDMLSVSSGTPFFSLTSVAGTIDDGSSMAQDGKKKEEAEKSQEQQDREALLALHYQYQLNDEERVVLYRDWRFAKEILLEDMQRSSSSAKKKHAVAVDKPINLLFEICHTPLEEVVMQKLRDALAADPNALQDADLTHRLSGWGDAKKRHDEMLALEQMERDEQKKKLTAADVEQRQRERTVLDDFFKVRKEHRVVSSGEIVPDLTPAERSAMQRHDELTVSTNILRRYRDELTPAPIPVVNVAPTVVGSHVELSFPPQRTITNYAVEHEQKCAVARASYCQDKRRRDNMGKDQVELERKTVTGMPIEDYKANVLREGLLRAKKEVASILLAGSKGDSSAHTPVQKGLWVRPEPRDTRAVDLKLSRAAGGVGIVSPKRNRGSPAPHDSEQHSVPQSVQRVENPLDTEPSSRIPTGKGKLRLGRLSATPSLLGSPSTVSSSDPLSSRAPTAEPSVMKLATPVTLFQK